MSGGSATMILSKVVWPVYQLSKFIEIKEYNNMLLGRNSADTDFKLIDDKSRESSSLGLRRIKYVSSPSIEAYKLYKLSIPIYRYSDLVVLSSTSPKFIDFSGKLFTYTKSMTVPLKYHKIEMYTEIDNGFLVHLKDIHCPFHINTEPPLGIHYAGVLHVGRGYILYSLEESRLKDTRRMI